jgi:hypothetical protein
MFSFLLYDFLRTLHTVSVVWSLLKVLVAVIFFIEVNFQHTKKFMHNKLLNSDSLAKDVICACRSISLGRGFIRPAYHSLPRNLVFRFNRVCSLFPSGLSKVKYFLPGKPEKMFWLFSSSLYTVVCYDPMFNRKSNIKFGPIIHILQM